MPSVAPTITRKNRGTHFVKNSKHNGPPNQKQTFASSATSQGQRFENVAMIDGLDNKLGFPRYEGGPKKIGWLVNMHSVCVESTHEKYMRFS